MVESNPRVPYRMASERAPLPPLAGKPLMVHVVLNVEYWPFDQPMPRGVIPPPHGKAGVVPDVGNFAWVEYGMRVGMPRLLRMLAERGIRASTFMNAMCADVYPRCAEAMLAADFEFVGHGWVQRSLAAEHDEAAVIERSLARLEQFTGKRTRGWFGPGVGESVHTPDLLKARGIEWLADWYVDDLPCWMRTDHGPMIAMPYTMELNDVPIWVVQGLPSDALLRRLEATLETFDAELAHNPKVLTFGLHPHLVGVAHRASWFAKCLDLLLARDDVVFVTGSEIADWFVQVEAAPA
jgi:peptidoglycan/xylan/chitin deacetylase (PgdA/CDA1 family)